MLDISTIMRKYGFNESEIKVYLTLINHEQMTGYEVSKLSGVARSKVYNVLENLIQKNMVLVNQTENKMYRAIPTDEFLARLEHIFKNDLKNLKQGFKEIKEPKRDAGHLWKVNDYTSMIEKIKYVISNAKVSIYIQIWTSDIDDELVNLIKLAEKRLTKVVIILFKDSEDNFDFKNVYYHGFEKDKLSDFGSRWINVVADNKQVVYGTINHHTTNVIWTENTAMISLASEYVKHDAYTLKIFRDLPEDLKKEYGVDFEGVREIY